MAVTVTNIVDVATAVVTSAHDRVPNWLHYVFNTADSVLAAVHHRSHRTGSGRPRTDAKPFPSGGNVAIYRRHAP